MNLELVEQTNFGEVEVDLYKNESNEVFMTIEQLAEALEYSNRNGVEKIIQRNTYLQDEDFSVTYRLSAADGKRYNTRVLTEDGIYEVTFLSQKPKARKFRQFVRNLLKKLRTGEFTVNRVASPSYLIKDEIKRARVWAQEQEKQLKLLEKVEEQQPKVEYHDKVLASDKSFPIQVFTKYYGTSAIKLNQLLNLLKVQYKQGDTWYLYQKYANKGYVQYRTGIQGYRHWKSMYWTEAGFKFIYLLLKGEGILPMNEMSNARRPRYLINKRVKALTEKKKNK